MVFQVTAQQDYERAVTLINTMAYAPFQISEKQWKELLEKNRDRISQEHLDKLLAALNNCDVASEATIFYLKRSLRSLCGSGTSRDFSSSVAFGSGPINASPLDDNDKEFDSGRKNVLPSDSECSEVPVTDCGDIPSSTSRDITGIVTVSESSNYDNDVDGEANSHTCVIGFGEDRASREFIDPLDKKFSAFDFTENSKDDNDREIDTLINGVDDSHESDLPSAYEVLEAWKESRKKDGIVFPFQLGQR